MKKLYAFAAAAVATLSMNAQLYVCGSGVGLEWTPENPYVVEKANDAYTFEIESLVAFKISTAMGSWDEFNAGCLVCEYTEDNIGEAVALVPGDANISTPWNGTWKVVVAGDYSTITMTTTTPKPEGPMAIYVRGEMNGWGASDEWKFSTEDNVTYTLHCTIEMGTKFKIADDAWGNFNYGPAGTEVYPDTDDMWNYNGGDGIMAEAFTGTISFDVPETTKGNIVVYFSSDSALDNVAVDANAPKEYFNLQGIRVAQPQPGLYIVRQGDKVSKQLVK